MTLEDHLDSLSTAVDQLRKYQGVDIDPELSTAINTVCVAFDDMNGSMLQYLRDYISGLKQDIDTAQSHIRERDHLLKHFMNELEGCRRAGGISLGEK
jgi:hypothetical protein